MSCDKTSCLIMLGFAKTIWYNDEVFNTIYYFALLKLHLWHMMCAFYHIYYDNQQASIWNALNSNVSLNYLQSSFYWSYIQVYHYFPYSEILYFISNEFTNWKKMVSAERSNAKCHDAVPSSTKHPLTLSLCNVKIVEKLTGTVLC